MMAQSNAIVVLLRETGVLAGGRPYRVRATQWFTFEGSKITRIEQIGSMTQGEL
jgi:hypothetical protein